MAISLQSFSTSVASMAAAAQGACTTLLDLTAGSVLRAILEAVAGVELWLQYFGVAILMRTRLATSAGSDVDSFVADFGATREPGTPATGLVTFTSLNPTAQSATIAVGSTVRTASAVTYAVTEDDTNPAWSGSASAYIRPAGTASITIPVQAQVVGTSGNVSAGAINLLGTSISGIDTVSNAAALTNALDAETDAALRARFVAYINTRSLATVAAVENAIATVQADLTYQVAENVDTSGAFRAGYFVAYVDDGSGAPSAALLASVYAAIDAVRGAGIAFAVQGPAVLEATVTMTVHVANNANVGTVTAAIQTAITAYLTGLPVGTAASYFQLSGIAYSVGASSLTGIASVLLNGGQVDIGGTFGQAVRPQSVTVSAG